MGPGDRHLPIKKNGSKTAFALLALQYQEVGIYRIDPHLVPDHALTEHQLALEGPHCLAALPTGDGHHQRHA
jgi:hypothetical protein